MKCQMCNREIERYGASAWNSCPGCGTRLMGFSDEMLPDTIKILSGEVFAVLNKLKQLKERLEQNRHKKEMEGGDYQIIRWYG